MNGVNRGVETPRVTKILPSHLADWQLPPEWTWGPSGMVGDYRHYQEVVDALGRSLSLVTAPDPNHTPWLFEEARQLAQRSHPSIPSTYHYWTKYADARRGPGYLRRWLRARRCARAWRDWDSPTSPTFFSCFGARALRSHICMRRASRTAVSTATRCGRHRRDGCGLLEWQWAIPREMIPPGVRPGNGPLEIRSREATRPMREELLPLPPEWESNEWVPTPASDQWQLAAMCFTALTGEAPPTRGAPPIKLVRPETPSRWRARSIVLCRQIPRIVFPRSRCCSAPSIAAIRRGRW